MVRTNTLILLGLGIALILLAAVSLLWTRQYAIQVARRVHGIRYPDGPPKEVIMRCRVVGAIIFFGGIITVVAALVD